MCWEKALPELKALKFETVIENLKRKFMERN
jgi:hypothetical protein